MKKHLLAMVFVAAAPLATARAQVFDLFPTDGGGNWQVSCVRLTANPLAPACDGSFVNASRVTVNPSGWAASPVAGPGGNAYYIAATPSASLWSDASNELENYEYTFRTQFNVGPEGPLNWINLNNFRLDNYFVGWSLNGGAFSNTGLSSGANIVNNAYWETPFTLQIPGSGFATGANTLSLRVRGNGRTDAILAQGTYSVPEPASMALLASGLMFLGVQVRRRRNG